MKKLVQQSAVCFLLIISLSALAQKKVENLGRGLAAMRFSADSVFVSWRLLATDPADIAFNVYRTTGHRQPVRINKQPLTLSTCFVDVNANRKENNSYFVKAVLKGKEGEKIDV